MTATIFPPLRTRSAVTRPSSSLAAAAATVATIDSPSMPQGTRTRQRTAPYGQRAAAWSASRSRRALSTAGAELPAARQAAGPSSTAAAAAPPKNSPAEARHAGAIGP